ncbi:deoxyribose-phosphate aldolase [Zeaxanthinibacter enoshimensis]|uniref:Deoxyribose-phosphate aldolase n=1 Tax=Zeaxanthinibacter enoshimensis TaxID=392009 RepID=A0A4R6TKB3_9FLAO|nr:deoxyribose-phosphate aldolase [Zeaxanthinibacter enoshimensis]TDQ31077.1 deoxyribose-phosphate aldolase [Zeaxanthinibacter enoshimensis]
MEIQNYIDHTLLKPYATRADIHKLCEEAIHYDFQSVCINGCHILTAREKLDSTGIAVCSVVGFPLGSSSTEAKVAEAKDYILKGADEIDMVINIGLIKDAKFEQVREEIRAVKDVVGDNILKVILETCHLTDSEIQKACELTIEAGGDYVKTSTGFGARGADLKVVNLMKTIVGDEIGIKAAGGIRDRQSALKFIAAGANRIGTSSGVAMMKE